jgi:hypothetical protein
MRYLRLLAVIGLVFAYPAAVAMAHKAPTKTETRALNKAYDNFIHFPVPAGCFTYSVSTANPSWAVQAPSSKPQRELPVICAKFSVGRVLFHRTGGRWRPYAATASNKGTGRCKLVGKPRPGPNRVVVPLAVARDLKLC